MTFVCLSIPAWPTDAATSAELARRAVSIAPRIRLEPARGILWADARGLSGSLIAEALLGLNGSAESGEVRAGVAETPIAAFVAARRGSAPIVLIPPGGDRAYLAPFDLGVLDPPPASSLYPLLAGIGIESCDDLSRLDPHSVEVRFGAEGVRIWKLARAEDHRLIFGPRSREHPQAQLEWVDYELASQEHVLFIVNSLLGTVSDALTVRREGAHQMTLELALADRSVVALPIRCSTPTAERKTWIRVIRAVLEPVTFSAPVTRIALRVDAATPLSDRQGNLFDAGFATARVAETALAHLLDRQPDAIAVARRTRHPLPEQRTAWVAEPSGVLEERPLAWAVTVEALTPRLSMQLFSTPREVMVRTVLRRDDRVPDRYVDGIRSYDLTTALGPDRVSGGLGEQRFEREYFQGIRPDGMMVLLYRDVALDRWFLAGWWD